MQAPNKHTPPSGSQPPFQVPGGFPGGGGGPQAGGGGGPHAGGGGGPQAGGGGGPQWWSGGGGPQPGPGGGGGGPQSALATPVPSASAPAVRQPATARPAIIFGGFIVNRLRSRLSAEAIELRLAHATPPGCGSAVPDVCSGSRFGQGEYAPDLVRAGRSGRAPYNWPMSVNRRVTRAGAAQC